MARIEPRRLLHTLAVLPLLLAPAAWAEEAEQFEPRNLEANHVAFLCAGMETEVVLRTGARADCVSETHAIEVDFTRKWADAIGQSLHYAAVLEKLPGMILVCHPTQSPDLCYRHFLRVGETFSYWTISMTVWLCPSAAVHLDSCTRTEFWGPE